MKRGRAASPTLCKENDIPIKHTLPPLFAKRGTFSYLFSDQVVKATVLMDFIFFIKSVRNMNNSVQFTYPKETTESLLLNR